MKPPRIIALSAALTITTIVVGLLIMEWGVRALAPQTLVRLYNIPDPDLGTYIAPNAHYIDPYTDEHKYVVRTNSHAFRMDEEVVLSPDRSRVFIYGDSFTFGWGVNIEASYFALLKKKLENARPSLQLINAGVGGYSSGHVKKLMERHIPQLRPRALIYFFNNNDLTDNAVTDPDYRVTEFSFDKHGTVALRDVKPFASWKRFLLNHTPYSWLNRNSHLFVLSKAALKRALNWKRQLNLPKITETSPTPKDTQAGNSFQSNDAATKQITK